MTKQIFYLLGFFITFHMTAAGALSEQSVPPSSLNDQSMTYSEQRVYIPYERLNEVLQSQEKGIFIPYSDFIKLWEEATKRPPEKVVPKPPLDGAIISAEYTGRVDHDIATFHGEINISALKEKWGKIELQFKDAAIKSASLNGKTPLLKSTPQGLELIVPRKGQYTLKIDFSTRVKSTPGKRFLDFHIPSAPLTRIQMTIPGKDLDVGIEPMLAMKSAVVNGNTQFSAFLSPEGKVHINWLAKSLDTKDERTLTFAKLFSELHIKESVYTFNTSVDFSIMQAKTDTFKIVIPPTLSLVRVDGKNISDWDLGEDGILTVKLHEKIDGVYRLFLITEKFRESHEGTLDIPQLGVVDAKREDGIIAIKADPSLRVKIEKRNRVTQIDPSELARQMNEDRLVAAFKYFRRPYLIRLGISKIKPKIFAHQNILVSFSETVIDYYANVKLDVKDAGVFELKFQIPESFRVAEVGKSNMVDSYGLSTENGHKVLRVSLKNKAYGKYLLPIHLEANKKDENLSLDLPKMKCLGVEQEHGAIAVSLRKNLKLSTQNVKSLRPISLQEIASIGIKERDPKNVLAAGYRYLTTDYSCTLTLEKRSTKIIAEVQRNIDLQETVLRVTDAVHYQILYAPVDHFKVELPASIGREANIAGENIKEKRFVVDDDEEKGFWLVELHAPRMNRYTLIVNVEKKLPEIKTRDMREIPIPPLRVLDVFHETGYISVSKSPNLQVDATEANLEPLDVKELPPTMNRNQSVLAFKYLTHPYELSLQSTKHEFEKVLDAIVNEAHFDIVVSREGIAKTAGVLRVQNTNRQSLELLMPEGTENIYSVFISGEKASISKGNSDKSKIIMLGKNIHPGREFTLRIIYQTRYGNDFGRFGKIPVESVEVMDVPMSKITWRLYLPEQFNYPYLNGSLDQTNHSHPLSGNVNTEFSSKRIQSQRRIIINEKAILPQSDEKTHYGLDMDIVREGRMYRLSKLNRNAFMSVWYIKKNAFLTGCVFLIALVTVIFIYYPIRVKTRGFPLIMFSTMGLFILWIALPQGFKTIALMMLFGIGIAILVHLGLLIQRRSRVSPGSDK